MRNRISTPETRAKAFDEILNNYKKNPMFQVKGTTEQRTPVYGDIVRISYIDAPGVVYVGYVVAVTKYEVFVKIDIVNSGDINDDGCMLPYTDVPIKELQTDMPDFTYEIIPVSDSMKYDYIEHVDAVSLLYTRQMLFATENETFVHAAEEAIGVTLIKKSIDFYNDLHLAS